jgi:hypothetical protein
MKSLLSRGDYIVYDKHSPNSLHEGAPIRVQVPEPSFLGAPEAYVTCPKLAKTEEVKHLITVISAY